MGDLLGSASLLVGVAGLIYSAWYAEIKAAIDLDVPAYGRTPLVRQVRSAKLTRALPITTVVVALTIALAPPAYGVFERSASALRAGDAHYDPVAACFVIVFITLVVLSCVCARDLVRLIVLGRRLKTPVEPTP